MTRNAENFLIRQRGFSGIDLGTDPVDLSTQKFADGYNWQCHCPRLGEARVRDGYRPVTRSHFNEPFKIMPGARGKLYTPPFLATLHPGEGGLPDTQGEEGSTWDFALRIGAAPDTGLYVNADHATQTVTFYVYGGDALGISSYSWTFGDGGTSSGASTSVSHDYTYAGFMRITCSGTGTDGNSYLASMYLVVEDRSVVEDPADPGTVPDPSPDGSSDTELITDTDNGGGGTTDGGGISPTGGTFVPDGSPEDRNATMPEIDLKINGLDDATISAAGSVTLSWTSRNAVEVYINSKRVTNNGSQSVNVTGSTSFLATAYASGGRRAHDTATVTVGTDALNRPIIDPEIRITGVSAIEEGTETTFQYAMWGRKGTSRDLEAMPFTGTVQAKQAESADVTSGYDESLTFAGETEKTGGGVTFNIAPRLTAAQATIRASVENIPNVVASHVVLVQATQVDFLVQVVDASGDLSEILVPDADTDHTFMLYLTARFPGTTTTDEEFQGVVEIATTAYEYAPDVLMNHSAVFTVASPGHASGPVAPADFLELSAARIPSGVWQDGKCTVWGTVQLPVVERYEAQGIPAVVYQRLRFSTVLISTESEVLNG